MPPPFLERKLFDREEQVAVKYLQSLLHLTQKQLAKFAHLNISNTKRAEDLYKALRYSSTARLVDTLKDELHKQGYLSEDKQLQFHHVAIPVS